MGGDYREAVQQKMMTVPNQAATPNQPVQERQEIPKNWLDDISSSVTGGYWIVFGVFLVGLSALTVFRKAFFKAVKKRVRKWVLEEDSSGAIEIKNE